MKNVVTAMALLFGLCSSVHAVNPVKQKPKTAVPAAVQKRGPSNTRANCSERGCACDELTKLTATCTSVSNPVNYAPRNQRNMRECYLNLVQKRRDVASAKASCPAFERAGAQIEDLKTRLSQNEGRSGDQHISSTKGLEGFGLDLAGHLGDNHRTPASGN